MSLLVAGLMHAVTAASFLAVARAVGRRSHGPRHGPLKAFAAWWLLLGLYLAMQAALYLSSVAAGPRLDWFVAASTAAVPLLCGATACLTYYILYLFTGWAGWKWVVGPLYAGTAVVFWWATFVPLPQGLAVSEWLVQFEGGRNVLLYRIVYFLVGLPPVASSVALLAATPRMERPQRYRATLVGIAILAYVGGGLVAFLGTNSTLKFLVLTGMGFLSSLSVLLAYFPPPAVRRRLRLDAPADPVAEAGRPPDGTRPVR